MSLEQLLRSEIRIYLSPAGDGQSPGGNTAGSKFERFKKRMNDDHPKPTESAQTGLGRRPGAPQPKEPVVTPPPEKVKERQLPGVD